MHDPSDFDLDSSEEEIQRAVSVRDDSEVLVPRMYRY